MLYILGYVYNKYNVGVVWSCPCPYPFGYEKEESACSGVVKTGGRQRRQSARRQHDPRSAPSGGKEGRASAVEEEPTDLNGPSRYSLVTEEEAQPGTKVRPGRLAVCIAYTYGWRMQSEVLTLTTAQMDMSAGTLRLEAGQTKNEDGRLVYLTPELCTLIAAQFERVGALGRKLQRIVPGLFPHLSGGRQGQRIRQFNKRWHTACVKAGLGMYLNASRRGKKYRRYRGPLLHDFRRTSVRNMVNKGVPERVAMTVTGHRTRSVFDRYHIVSPRDLQEVARKLTGTIWGQQPQAAVDATH